MTRGTTLIELAASLALLGVLTGLLSPTVTDFRDRASVLEARERFAALVVDARRVARDRGGSTLVVQSEPGGASLIAGTDTVRVVVWPTSRGDPEVLIGGSRGRIELAFDRAGLGRFANVTMDFRKGRASSQLVVSSYGRVRRR